MPRGRPSKMPSLAVQLVGATLAGASAAWLLTWLSRPVQISSAPPSPSEDVCFNNIFECPRSSNDTVDVGYVRCLPPLNFDCPTLTCTPDSCSANFTSLLHNRPEDWISNVVGQVAARNLAVVSGRRLRATAHLARTAINRCLQGDIVETGVYTGGSTSILMRALIDYDGCGRKLWAFDSFKGLPLATNFDMQGDATVGVAGDYSADFQVFKQNLQSLGAWDEKRIVVTKGFFAETVHKSKVKAISFLRMDGDLYTSTWDVLIGLYDRVLPDGLVYVDDYGSYNGCREAVDRFRTENRIYEPLHHITEKDRSVEAVWWQKRSRKVRSTVQPVYSALDRQSMTTRTGGEKEVN